MLASQWCCYSSRKRLLIATLPGQVEAHTTRTAPCGRLEPLRPGKPTPTHHTAPCRRSEPLVLGFRQSDYERA